MLLPGTVGKEREQAFAGHFYYQHETFHGGGQERKACGFIDCWCVRGSRCYNTAELPDKYLVWWRRSVIRLPKKSNQPGGCQLLAKS